jgi:hypothetical protein
MHVNVDYFYGYDVPQYSLNFYETKGGYVGYKMVIVEEGHGSPVGPR